MANGVKMGRKPKLTPHQKREAIPRRERGEESLAEIGRSYNVSGWTIASYKHEQMPPHWQRVLFFPVGDGAVMKDFEIIQLSIGEASIQGLDNRLRNQLMGCMHAHNELTVLNRVFMFGINPVGDGELADAAGSVQMWCLLQVLAGKLYETWLMVIKRFLAAVPEDAAIAGLNSNHRTSLNWLKASIILVQRSSSVRSSL
jgi:hypothetical protein